MKISKGLYFNNLKGYKISNSHFELGSNLHIEDYYYVKRLFYNSFYTNRFAFLIASFILKELEGKIVPYLEEAQTKQDPLITLLGFENYTELLISNVRKMLNDYIEKKYKPGFELFNHEIYTKEFLFLKNPGKIGKYVISIFPISTTFSTSIKIHNEIREMLKDKKLVDEIPVFLDPVINCLIITNRLLDKDTPFSKPMIEAEFGWKSVNTLKKIISVQDYDRTYTEKTGSQDKAAAVEKKVEQKYFISLHTPWLKINECKACYPDIPTEEVCMIETKQTPVTPNLIFGYPKTYNYEPQGNIFPLFDIKRSKNGIEPLVYRKHFFRHDAHYIYYIRTGRFLQENKAEVTEFLNGLRDGSFRPVLDKNVVIITPTYGSNSGFVNLFNDIVFSDTATIIQYNPKEEFIQNFKLFYADIITNAHCVLFVDDVIGTTATISEINFFVQNLRKYNEGLNCCISLINRVGYYNYLKLQNKFRHRKETDSIPNHIISFKYINVPPLMHRDRYPYDELMYKFRDLSEKSVLDGMKIHFRNLEREFKPIDLAKEYAKFEKEGLPKALLQFLFMHEFSAIFRVDNASGGYIQQQVITKIFETSAPLSYETLLAELEKENNVVTSFLRAYPEYTNELKYILFKLCSSDPHIKFRMIRKTVFNWVLYELSLAVAGINQQPDIGRGFFEAIDEGYPVVHSKYERFRFLLIRGAKLKMNYIYSLETLNAVAVVLEGISKYKKIQYFKKEESIASLGIKPPPLVPGRSEAIYSIQFITFYVGILQELIIDHESKALQIVVYIKRIIQHNLKLDPNGKTLKNSYNDDFMHLLRLLVLENTFIFHTSSDKFLNKMSPAARFNSNKYPDFNKKFDYFRDTYTFSYTEKMLSRFNFEKGGVEYEGQKDVFLSFKNMLLLKALLRNDKKDKKPGNDISIKNKLDVILKLCCDILGIVNGGAYLAVRYKNKEIQPATEDDIAIVGEYSQNINNPLKADELGEESLLFKVFNGTTEYNTESPSSIYEVTLDADLNYHFRRNQQVTDSNIYDLAELHRPRYKKIFFLRITEIEYNEKSRSYEASPLAVLCFYQDELTEKENQLIDRNMEQIKAAGAILTHRIGNDYERFDPKKVRQLLLLRNDLGEFINLHLNNDSLRSYIEMINNENYHITLNHGTNIYESLVKNYIKKVNDADDLPEAKEMANYLQVTFYYLINKFHLAAEAASAGYDDIDAYPDGNLKSFSVKQITDAFKKEAKYLLMFHQENLARIKQEDYLNVDSSTITDEQLAMKFLLIKGIFNEMIFEILYNIKKHAVNENVSEISADNKLNIEMTLLEVEGIWWFCVSNNFSKKDPHLLSRVNKQIGKRQNTHGLNLLYHIIFKLTGYQVYLENSGDVFSIYIPLKPKSNA